MNKTTEKELQKAVVAANLIQQGFTVFREVGDQEEVDLLFFKDIKEIHGLRIKVKNANAKNAVRLTVSSPTSTEFPYIVAIIVPNRNEVLYLSKDDTWNKIRWTFIFGYPKNGQIDKATYANEYTDVNTAVGLKVREKPASWRDDDTINA
jgi:hypothetical protein